MDSEYKYFSSEYKKYYEGIQNNEQNSLNLKSEVESIADDFSSINDLMTTWKGAASSSTAAVIDTILNKFNVTKENIDCSLIPAVEAMNELSSCLESLKKMDEDLQSKEKSLEAEKSRNVPETIADGKDKNGKTKYKHNSEYDAWKSNIERLSNEISLLTEELEELKLKCDSLIQDIKKFESSIRQFSDLVDFSKQLFGINVSDSGISGMSLEEKLAYLDSLIDNYASIYEQLNEIYNDTYGDGIPFSIKDFEKINTLFEVFDIYAKSGVKSNDLVSKYDNSANLLFDIEKLQKILRYCDNNEVFKKIESYINGESWEGSGIASLYEGDLFAYNEQKFLERMRKKYGVSDARAYLKENSSSIFSSVQNLNTTYEDYRSLLSIMGALNSKRDQLENARLLAPFEHEMENLDFQAYLNKDYDLYNLIDKEKLSFLSKQEVALFNYLYNTKSPSYAEDYLKAMDDAINQRIGSSKASEYVAFILQDGFQATDLIGSGFEGVKDGVRGWWDGILDLGRVGSTEAGTKSAFDYELMYKSQYIYELAEQYGITDSECSWINQFYQTGSSVGNMLVPMASSFIPVAGQVLSPALMGLSITGNSAVEARQNGATLGQAYIYGALSGLSESATEVMIGGIPGISKLENLHIGNKALNTIANFFANSVSEGLEEYTQTYLDAGINKLVFGEDFPDLSTLHKEGVEAFKQGAITSGVLQGINAGGVKVLDKVTTTASSVFGSGVYDSTMPNAFARFKSDMESRFQGAEVQNAINKLASGDSISLIEGVKINNLLKKTSAEEISSITSNMEEQAHRNLLQSDVLSKKNRENIVLADAMNTIKSNPGKSVMEVEGIDIKTLHEEVTSDGRTLSEYLIDNSRNPEAVIESVKKQGGIEASLTASKMESRLKSNISEQIKYQNSVQRTVENATVVINDSSSKMANGDSLTFFEKGKLNNAIKSLSVEELSGVTSSLSVEQRNTLNSDVLGKTTMRRIAASNMLQNAVFDGEVPTDVLTLKQNVSRDGRNMAEYLADINPSAITENTVNEIAKTSPVLAESISARIKSNAILDTMAQESVQSNTTISDNTMAMGSVLGLAGTLLNSVGINTSTDSNTLSISDNIGKNNYVVNAATVTTSNTNRSFINQATEVKIEQDSLFNKNGSLNSSERTLGNGNDYMGRINGDTSFAGTFDDNLMSVQKDIEYAINKYIEKYNFPRERVLRIVDRLIQTGEFNLMTSNGNAREILMSHSRESLKAAYNSIIQMEQVTSSMEEDVRYCISKLVEKYNFSEQEAINNIKKLVETENYYRMTRHGDARAIISKYSFFQIENIIKKIELKNSMNYGHLSQNINTGIVVLDLFEKNGNSTNDTYGVDQGLFYNMFKFRLNGTNYSYRQAMEMVKRATDNHLVVPSFRKIGSSEYFAVKENIVNKYGFSETEASIILSCIDDTGACSYAAVCNEIFRAFDGKEMDFEEAFGYPMFDYADGHRVLNSKNLLLDLYIYVNTEGNGGHFIIPLENGKYKLNSSLMGEKIDPLGRKLLKTDEQVYLSNSHGSNKDLINSFLSSKGYEYESLVKKEAHAKLNNDQMITLINDVKTGLSNGVLYSMGIYSSGGKINMISANPESYKSVSTLSWSEGGGHAIFVTGVTNDSFVVSSWGKKYYIPFSDLINGKWILREDVIAPKNSFSSKFSLDRANNLVFPFGKGRYDFNNNAVIYDGASQSRMLFSPDFYANARTSSIVNSMKDMESAVTEIMRQTNCSRSSALSRINEIIKSGGHFYVNTTAGYKDILKSYSSDIITEAYNSITQMEKVTDRMVSDIVYVIHRTAEMYNIPNEEALNMLYKMCDSKSIRTLPNIELIRPLFSQYLSEDVRLTLRKIELYDMVNRSVSSLSTLSNYHIPNSSSPFEKVGISDFGTYGVNQGDLYNMFEFVDKSSGKRYTYFEARKMVQSVLRGHGVMPNFIKYCTPKYFELKDYVVKKYGFSENEASILISSINNTGACSYAAVCNEIFKAFYDKPTEFERAFGYPIFDFVDGIETFNSKKLLLDLYVYANTEVNGGQFIISNGNGGYRLNSIALGSYNMDPLGRKILETENQNYMSTVEGVNEKLVNSFLNSKGYSYKAFSKVDYDTFLQDTQMKNLIANVKSGLSNGMTYELIVVHEKGDKNVKMIPANPRIYKEENTQLWNNGRGAGHAVFVTDVTDDSFVVSSWGRKYYILFKNLTNRNHWILSEAMITPNGNLKNSTSSSSIIDYLDTFDLNGIFEELSKLDNASFERLYEELGNTKTELMIMPFIESFLIKDPSRLVDFFNHILTCGKKDSVLIKIANNVPINVGVKVAISDNNLNSTVRDFYIREILSGKCGNIELDASMLQSQGIKSINRIIEKLASKGENTVVKLKGDLKDPNISKILYYIDNRATIMLNGVVIRR